MDELRKICQSRNLVDPEISLDENIADGLAQLVLNDAEYAIPVFASFRNIALPIASQWIIGNASTDNYELVFCRLSSLVPLLPVLLPLTEHLLMMQNGHSSSLAASGNDEVLSGIIELLLYDYGRFARYFSAEDLRNVASQSDRVSIRSLALTALALLMEVSESELEQWIRNYCGDESVLENLEFNHFLRRSQTRSKDAQLIAEHSTDNLKSDLNFENSLVTNIAGVFVHKSGGFVSHKGCQRFISTETSELNLHNAAVALLQDKPILLIGKSGSGKSTIVDYLHGRVRGGDLVRIHLGDQTEAKSLIGTFTTGQKAGTFEWMPGALTSAVQNGSWVLIEDIDRAPGEIVTVLLSLLTSRELVIPSRNQVVKASPGFQIIATTSAVPHMTNKLSADIVGARSWFPVVLTAPNNDDLECMIKLMKPFLTPLAASMLVTCFRRVEKWQEDNKVARLTSTSDLVKLANRLDRSYSTENIFREAVSCFASFLPDPMPLAHIIGDSMGLPSSQIEPLLKRYQPFLSLHDNELIVGRAKLERRSVTSSAAHNMDSALSTSNFALTQPTLRLIEEIAVAVQHKEPVLLVGETGTGKTAVVQQLAKLSRRKLVVINVSQQVEAGDLIGGFKPVDARQLAGSLLDEFNLLFEVTFSRAKNHQFMEVLDKVVSKQQWTNVVKLLREAIKMAGVRSTSSKSIRTSVNSSKRVRLQDPSSSADWMQFSLQVDNFEEKLKAVQQTAQFHFTEGLLVRAIRQGSWVLLDELNLAPPDTVEGIGELISSRQLTILENGGQVVNAHPAFRLFANMNPATDVGKKDLPSAVRNQFSEIWSLSPEFDQEALRAIISRYLSTGTDSVVINDIAQLYTKARALAASHQLADGAGQRPHFSIRTLSRALSTAANIAKMYGLRRALYEAFSMCFLTLLDDSSSKKLSSVLEEHLLAKIPNRKSVLAQVPSKPNAGRFVQFAHWWMPCGSKELSGDPDYILTPSIERNLLNLVRASSTKMYPIMIQGPTSSGKTSMISHLAKRTGHSVVRINNHEHTDLVEYLGGYESDIDGKLVFREGALVKALREGHWLILDELNLAPTDVLEALNRLLDDNRELLVPETQEIIRPHPDFILFATQNPPGLYAGRKVLSRAFRNRFLELHFGEIPEDELEIILRDRSKIAPSYASKIVEVYRELARQRIQRVFEHTATLRDLFRWAMRPAIGYEQLAFNGYALLGERSRTKSERNAIKAIIERIMKVQITTDVANLASEKIMSAAPKDIVWTGAMRRILALVEMAIRQNEPVLLLGETGCGKTTIVQVLAAAQNQRLITFNAHQNTETGDLIGSQRPVRSSQSTKLFEWVDGPLVVALKEGHMFLLDEISLADDSVLERLNSVLEPERTLFVPEIGAVEASAQFQFLATMNPGGDYGKKELSPALRNRFTEIWCPTVDDDEDLRIIIEQKLGKAKNSYSIEVTTKIMVDFSKWFSENIGLVSLRDILSWVEFLLAVEINETNIVQGACMVFIDGLGAHTQFMSNSTAIKSAQRQCYAKLDALIGENVAQSINFQAPVAFGSDRVTIGGFTLPVNENSGKKEASTFNLDAPTTSLNAMRVARAMKVRKPILLEGSPGAGKTSLVSAIAAMCGQKLTRINLSDQTDLSDLFGQDVPLEEPGKFGWRNAPFLKAMQLGEWVLLDEMNLAPQPVLEGLNACLDHRGEAFIPELDRTFTKHPNFTVFAAQNPHGQGGGRKGLPKSFINRFSVVYVDQLGIADLHQIAATTHPTISAATREKLALFVQELALWSATHVLAGGPFEFNLRDTLRWLDLIADNLQEGENPQKFFKMIILQRFRTEGDKLAVLNMFLKYFPQQAEESISPISVSSTKLQVKDAKIERKWPNWQVHDQLSFLTDQLDVLEIGIRCISKSWPLVLVGPSGSGKSAIVRLLAQLNGSKLREFMLTPDIDSTDLLGEFDQMEYESELQRLWAAIEDQLRTKVLIEDAALVDAVRNRDLSMVKHLIMGRSSIVSDTIEAFESMDFNKPIFHWVDGMLVKAVENGDWLVLDNANLCSAAVLDRLNSLLERNGSLLVNECAQDDGSPREVKPHANFRLFLTIDPRFGELSRAMRNRAVEVWLDCENSSYDKLCKEKLMVNGTMPLQFTSPLMIAKMSDLKRTSWIQGLLLNESKISPKHLSYADSNLKAFSETLKPGNRSVKALYMAWCSFTLSSRLEVAIKSKNDENLLNLSALRRVRDSIECEFDIYGLIEASLTLHTTDVELLSTMIDFSFVKDPSRVPVYRNWFLNWAEKVNDPDFANRVRFTLGKQYDLSQGGYGMERIWQKFGKHIGFTDKNSHEKECEAIKLAEKLDSYVEQIGSAYASEVSEIRKILSVATSVDEPLYLAVESFQETIEAIKRSVAYKGDRIAGKKFLMDQFKSLWSGLSLVYASKSSKDQSHLKSSFTRMSTFAGLKTSDVREIFSLNETRLSFPMISVPQQLEESVIQILRITNEGQCHDELSEFVANIAEFSNDIVQSMNVSPLIFRIVQRFAGKMLEVVPEVADYSNIEDYASGNFEDTGKGAVLIAKLLLDMYVCPLPLDPAIGQHVWFERYLRLKEEYAGDELSWVELQRVFGSKSEEVELFFSTRSVQQEPMPAIWRPPQSLIGLVHRDMVAAVQLASNALKSKVSADEIEVILNNAQHLATRLARSIGYRDLTDAVRGAISLLQLGMSFKSRKIQASAVESLNENNLWLIDPTTVGRVALVNGNYPLLVLRSMKYCQTIPIKEFQELLFDIYRRWTLERLHVEKKKRQESSGFRYADDEDDEVIAEREFRALFPDYDEVPELPPTEDFFMPDLVNLYCDLLAADSSKPRDSIVDGIVVAVQQLNKAEGSSSALHLPALYLALKRRANSVSKTKDVNFNFYIDTSYEEVLRSTLFAESILRGVSPLLMNWPEHDTLQTLDRVSREILALPPRTPVALRLSKVEQVHHYLYEWDRFAPKDHKVGKLMAETSELIVSWRRLELATWPALFSVEKRRASDAAAPLWFHLFEILISSPADDMGEIAKILIVFMAESPIGQFEQRLLLLAAFAKNLELIKADEVRTCVSNVHEFYSQYLDQNKQILLDLETELRKQVDEVVRLASWRDVNIHALRQSAQRSHRQLFKVVKKYRAALERRVETDSDKSLLESTFKAPSISVFHGATEWLPEWALTLKNTAEWAERPQYMRDLLKISQNMKAYTDRIVRWGSDFVKSADLLTFANDIVEKSVKLRDDTPQKWTKETKKTITALKVEKQKLLTETLRELKRSGLKTAVSKSTLARQHSLTRVLASMPPLIDRKDPIFFQLVAILPKLRSTVSEASRNNNLSNDVPQQDLQRGLAFAENCFACVTNMRGIAARHQEASRLEPARLIHNLTEFAKCPVNLPFEAKKVEEFMDAASHLTNNVLEFAISTASELPNSDIAERNLLELQQYLNLSQLSEIQKCSDAGEKWFDSLTLELDSVLSTLENDTAGGMILPLLSQLRVHILNYSKCFKEMKLVSDDESLTLEPIILKACQPVLVLIQQVLKLIKNENDSNIAGRNEMIEEEEDHEWLTESISLCGKLILILRPSEIWPRFVNAAQECYYLSVSRPELAGSYAANILVFIHGYKQLSNTLECVYFQLLQRTSGGLLKLSYLLHGLAIDGFCSPSPTEDDCDDEDSKADGTGLGDGQGGQSTSNEINEEDDDVTEAMQTSNPEQQEREKDDDEEDKAKEMDGDMAGELEDAPPQGENDANENEGQNDVDEEIGDIDNIDAVDEKMWNDETETNNQKEKETNQGVQGDDDEDMRANDEKREQNQSESMKGRDGENENGQDDAEENAQSDAENGSSDTESPEDQIDQSDRNELDPDVEQKNALDLPVDMKLDDGEEKDMIDDGEEEDLAKKTEVTDSEFDGDDAGDINDEDDQDLPDLKAGDESDGKKDMKEETDSDPDQGNYQEISDDEGDDENMEGDKSEDLVEEKNKDQSFDGKEVEAKDAEADHDNSEGGAHKCGAAIEGLQDPNDNKDAKQENQATTSEQQNQSRGDGTQEDADREQENVTTDSSGARGAPQPQDKTGDTNSDRDAVKESLRQLGDAMKEFHRRQKAIQEHSSEFEKLEGSQADDTKDTALDGTEKLQHVGAEDAFDTQALGKSNNDERQEIDDAMAIDDEANHNEACEAEVAGEEDKNAESGAGCVADAVNEESEDEKFRPHEPEINANSGDFDEMDADERPNQRQINTESGNEQANNDLWQVYENKTHDLALILGEQLRLILEPTVASKLRGDYRTGKRLNMKRIIPYIASEFRKDKIWLRRSKPAKREYQILLALDDSKSMGDPTVVDIAFQAIALVGKALNSIEAGQVGIAKFGSSTEIVHSLERPFTPQAGNLAFKKFSFNQLRTNIHQLLETSLEMFSASQHSTAQWKLEIIISDGITDDHKGIRTLVRRAYDERVMLVFVIVDALNKETSILDMNEVRYTNDEVGNPKLEVVKYMNDFPFDYYVLVGDINDLPMVLASVLRQYFQAVDL